MKQTPEFQADGLTVFLHKKGAPHYGKVSWPVRYGLFHEIRTEDYLYQFNLNGEIKYLQGLRNWPDPQEWLKRTAGNDWIYYYGGAYGRAFSHTGEYYVPCLSYRSNAIMGGDFFRRGEVADAVKSLKSLLQRLRRIPPESASSQVREVVERIVAANGNGSPARRADEFHTITDGHASVLPPDVRHVDYDVIPVNVSDGCLYNCGFCRVKTGRFFSVFSKEVVLEELRALKDFYGPDIVNYSSIFLGRHDALMAGIDHLVFAAESAYDIFDFRRSYMKQPAMFLFGSADSFLRADSGLFELLSRLDFRTYINIGLESADEKTLERLEKPVSAGKVVAAFDKMTDVNRTYQNIEITANFLISEGMPDSHFSSVADLLSNRVPRRSDKGAIYLSPLMMNSDRNRLRSLFLDLKNRSRLPVYLYLIQRL